MPVVKNRWGNYVKMRGQGMGGNNCRSNTVTCAIAGERGTEWDGRTHLRRGASSSHDPPLPLMTVQGERPALAHTAECITGETEQVLRTSALEI